MRCRKKPIICEYYPVDMILHQDWSNLPKWVMDGFGAKEQLWIPSVGPRHLVVKTLEGSLKAPDDGYLIQGINGEVWPIAADIFAKTYDIVD